MTIGELYGPAMEITDQEEADAYFDMLVTNAVYSYSLTREEAEKAVRDSLGYYAAYYNNETRARVERLFHCIHPVFGSITQGTPTAQKAFDLGQKLGLNRRNNT